MKVGTDRHLRLQKAIDNMKNNNIDCEYIDVAEFINRRNIQDVEIIDKKEMETKLYNPKLNMSFLCDGIIKYKSKYYILEIKTESSNKFMKRQNVDESHFDQAVSYSINLGLNDVMFLYECRDVCLKKTYIFHVTEEMKKELLERIENCNKCVQELKPPAKPTNISKSTCSYCAYKKYCDKYNY